MHQHIQNICTVVMQARGAQYEATDSAAAAGKLEVLIRRLDSLLPYLNIAISAVGLLDHGMCMQQILLRFALHCTRMF